MTKLMIATLVMLGVFAFAGSSGAPASAAPGRCTWFCESSGNPHGFPTSTSCQADCATACQPTCGL
jgi:hypothetical protein